MKEFKFFTPEKKEIPEGVVYAPYVPVSIVPTMDPPGNNGIHNNGLEINPNRFGELTHNNNDSLVDNLRNQILNTAGLSSVRNRIGGGESFWSRALGISKYR